jgi:hypothetical protein
MITSNLDWDDEALEDKFLKGLKPEIRRALIYYPTEPRNLEELFERAQKIDREIWGQRTSLAKEETTDTPRRDFSKKDKPSEWTEMAILR